MKTYKRLYDKCLDKDFIKAMIIEAGKGKKKRADVRRTLEKVEYYSEIIYDMMEKEAYEPRIPKETVINEGTRPKKRVIRKVRFFDQIIHHMVVNTCSEVFNTGMYQFCCGSVPQRGTKYAKQHIERWLRTDFKNTKYCVQMDIKHYFDSVDHEVLKKLLSRKIKDKRMMQLLEKIIDSCETGLPLGYYTSQWFANFLLEGLDHYIKEQLHVKYYVRYLDDMIVFGRNKKELHRARAAIAEYLEKELNLQMKENYQLFRLIYKDKQGKERGRALDFLGYRFYRDKTILRKSLLFKITRTAARIGKKDRPTYYDAAAMLSYMGWIHSSNSYNMYRSWVKQKIDIKQLKKIVSKKSKERSKAHAYDFMERNNGDTRRKARIN